MTGTGELTSHYHVRLAANPTEVDLALALRYRVFGAELGGGGPTVDHETGRESDRMDVFCDHLLLFFGEDVVGTYRLMDQAGAALAGGFYTEGEFDLSGVKRSGRVLMEVGRSCLAAEHRGGAAMLHLWAGLVGEVKRRGAGLIFGAGSFAGTDRAVIGPLVRLLEERYGAGPDLCPVVRASGAMDLAGILPPDDTVKAMQKVPPLLKSYLRAGARIGQGAYVDHDLGLTDVCIVLDAATAVWPAQPDAAR